MKITLCTFRLTHVDLQVRDGNAFVFVVSVTDTIPLADNNIISQTILVLSVYHLSLRNITARLPLSCKGDRGRICNRLVSNPYCI